LAVASPDPGGVKRAQLFREMLERELKRPVGQAFIDKRRSAGVVSGDMLVGDVKNATVLVLDDLVSTGGTMARAAAAAMENGAREVMAFAAHGLFTGDAQATLAAAPLSRIVVTDSVSPFRLDAAFAASRIQIASAAPLFAGCIDCLHDGASMARLLGDESENG
jgi:ribose-phosphate pyrophosphokinase